MPFILNSLMMEIKITQISNRPNSIPRISVYKIIDGVVAEVIPMERPTVPRADENSNSDS